MFRTDRTASASGFTLVEVLIAVAIFITLSVGVAQLIAVATGAVRAARERTSAAILAGAKMEQLRSLAWTYFPPEAGDPALEHAPVCGLHGRRRTLGGAWQRSTPKRGLHQAMGGATPCDRSGADARLAGPRDDGSR